MASGICKCGHPSIFHFRWDGARAACRIKADGSLTASRGGDWDWNGCECTKYEEAK